MPIEGTVDVVVGPPALAAVGETVIGVGKPKAVTHFHTTPGEREQRQMSPAKNSGDLYEVMTDSWGSSPPIYPKGHILSADTVAPGRDLEWAAGVGAVRLLASDDPRRKAGPSPEPVGHPLLMGDDGWSDPAFPYQAPVTRAESEGIAAATRAFEAGAAATSAAEAAKAAEEAAKATADAAAAAKARATATEKMAASAVKVAEKEGSDRPPSSADIQAGVAGIGHDVPKTDAPKV